MTQRITADLHELVYAMDSYAEAVLRTRFGVDRNLFAYLVPLASGPLDITRLAERLNLTRAAVSKRVPVLERDGWLTSASDPHRRRVTLRLTPQGRDLVAEASGLLTERFTDLLDGAAIDVDTFGRQVRSLIVSVRALDAEAAS